MKEETRKVDALDRQLAESCGGPEEAAALRRSLSLYTLPPEEPGAAEAFWAQLQPRLAPRKPDPALCLTPLILAAGHALWQGVLVALGIITLTGGWTALTAWMAQINLVPASWGNCGPLPDLHSLAALIPASWAAPLGWVGLFAMSWALLLGLALCYGAWLFL